jgi:hypothetical protein
MWRAVVLLPILLLTSRAEADVTIVYHVYVRSMRETPAREMTSGTFRGTLILKENGVVNAQGTDLGQTPRTTSSQDRLGSDYRVIDANTIRRTITNPNYLQTVTIHVKGSSCWIERTIKLQPGQKYFEFYSPKYASNQKYSSSDMVRATCEITATQ